MSSEGCVPDATVHVASKNTRVYTELCLRSMWRLAGGSFQLVVGDCSSEDGSQQFLRRMAADGLLTLQELPADTSHSDWIDRWRNECRTKYFVVVDSDVEFLEPNWLPRLLAALGSRSMLSYGVAPEMRYRETRFGEPFEYTLLMRPDPCVLLLDHARTQMITASFAWREEAHRWPPEKAYDVGGYFASHWSRKVIRGQRCPHPSRTRSIISAVDRGRRVLPTRDTRSTPERASKSNHRLTPSARSCKTDEMVLWANARVRATIMSEADEV